MDMNIAGRGIFFPGSYKNIKVSGRASATGVVNCTGLEVSGKPESKTVSCSGLVGVSGSSYKVCLARFNKVTPSVKTYGFDRSLV